MQLNSGCLESTEQGWQQWCLMGYLNLRRLLPAKLHGRDRAELSAVVQPLGLVPETSVLVGLGLFWWEIEAERSCPL